MSKRGPDAAKEGFWREVLQRFAASGLGVRGFCQREQLVESAFYAWRRTIGQRDQAGRSGPAFVPAQVTAPPPSAPSIALELACGCVLRFSGGAAGEQLADLVVALQSRAGR